MHYFFRKLDVQRSGQTVTGGLLASKKIQGKTQAISKITNKKVSVCTAVHCSQYCRHGKMILEE